MANFEANAAGMLEEEDLVADGWTDIAREIRLAVVKGNVKLSQDEITQLADYKKVCPRR